MQKSYRFQAFSHSIEEVKQDSRGEIDDYKSEEDSKVREVPPWQKLKHGSVKQDQFVEDNEKLFYFQGLKRKDGFESQGLIKSFTRRKKFSDAWKKFSKNTISLYEIMESMCQINNEVRLKAIPVLQSEDTLRYYSSNIHDCSNNADAV